MYSSSANTLLSVIVPCFNEEAVIRETHIQLVKVLSEIPDLDFEIIYIDDGSRDNTLMILKEIQSHSNHVRVISFSRNFGHQIAVTAGLDHASGCVVVLIDADLQDPPDVIHEMIDRWRNGADVVYGVRQEREGETAFKLWTAKAFYRIINHMSDISIPLDTGDFRLMDRKVVDSLLEMPERDRFVRGMVAWVGFRQEPLLYKRASRFAGTTKYPLAKMVRFAIDGILSFSLVPLRISTYLGFLISCLSVCGILYAIIMRIIMNNWVPGWALLLIAFLFIGGIQLVFLGIMGEYLGRVYGEVKHRPLYIMKERLGFSETKPLPSLKTRKALV